MQAKFQKTGGSPGLYVYPTLEARYSYDLFTGHFTADLFGFSNRLSYTDVEKKNTNPAKNLDKVLRIEKIREELTRQASLDFLGILGDLTLGSGLEKASAASTGFSTRDELNGWGFASLSRQLDRIPVQLGLGLRFENFSKFGGYFSPEFTAGIQKDIWSARLSLSRTHNIPSFYQRYYQSSSMQPNPDLSPEQADNFSLALSWKLSSRVKFDISPFYSFANLKLTHQGNKLQPKIDPPVTNF